MNNDDYVPYQVTKAATIDGWREPERRSKLPLIVAVCGLLTVAYVGGLVTGLMRSRVDYVKLTPQVVVTYAQNNNLRFRLGVTNNYIFQFSPTNVGTYLKFDWFYGNHDATRELDMNMR